MANDIIIPKNFGEVSTLFSAEALSVNDEFASGITGGFAVLGFRGKVWRVKHRGEEAALLNEDGTPQGSVDLILVKAASNLSKTFYPNGYQEGSTEAPTCASANGVTPDEGVPEPQASTCAMCPNNQWGSRITEKGNKGKACADTKRVAVVPLDDPHNEVYGGPMLLRIPAASLQDLATYANKMKGFGFPLNFVGTRIRFDVDAAYPKLVLSAARALTDEEVALVNELRSDHRTLHILNSSDDGSGAALPSQAFEDQPPQAPAPTPRAAAPKAPPAPVRPAAAAPKPAPAPVAAKPVFVVPKAAPAAPAARPTAAPVARPATAPVARPGGIAGAVARPVAARPAAPPPPPPEPEYEEGQVEETWGGEEEGGLPPSFTAELDDQLNNLL